MQFSRDQYNEPQVHGLKYSTWEFSGGPVVRTHQSHSWDWVPSLVGELLTQCTKKKKKKGRLGENSCSRLLFLLLKTTLSVTPRTAAHQASLSSTIFWSLLKLMSIEPVMPSNHLILCRPLLLLPSAAAKLLQSCPTLCDPIDGSQLGSPVPGILQARALEWVAISFSTSCPQSCPNQGLFQ